MSRVRTCLGCGVLGEHGRTGRCDDCRLKRNRRIDRSPTRRAIKLNRYDAEHRRLRQQWQLLVNAGGVICARFPESGCEGAIAPGADFHLDHLVNGERRPSHPTCNVAARSNPRKVPNV